MNCTKCLQPIAVTHKFCAVCGTTNTANCPKCAKQFGDSDKFCAVCGTSRHAPQGSNCSSSKCRCGNDLTPNHRFCIKCGMAVQCAPNTAESFKPTVNCKCGFALVDTHKFCIKCGRNALEQLNAVGSLQSAQSASPPFAANGAADMQANAAAPSIKDEKALIDDEIKNMLD